MKQFITRKIILLAVMLLTSVGSSFAFEYGGLTYRVIDNDAKTVKVTYQGSDAYSNPYTKSSIVIPETVDFNGNTYTVVEIGDNAFQNAALSSITIPATVKRLNCQKHFSQYLTVCFLCVQALLTFPLIISLRLVSLLFQIPGLHLSLFLVTVSE